MLRALRDGTSFAPSTSTLASLWRLANSASGTVDTSAARTPLALFAAIAIPIPDLHMRMARSASLL